MGQAKRLINRRTLPAPEDLIETQEVFLEATTWPWTAKRGALIRRRMGEVGIDFEMRMGHHLGTLGGDEF